MIDPNVQVALVGALATTVTTTGVVAVAVINNGNKKPEKAADQKVVGVNDDKTAEEMLERINTLLEIIEENNGTIKGLRQQIKTMEETNMKLANQLGSLGHDVVQNVIDNSEKETK